MHVSSKVNFGAGIIKYIGTGNMFYISGTCNMVTGSISCNQQCLCGISTVGSAMMPRPSCRGTGHWANNV